MVRSRVSFADDEAPFARVALGSESIFAVTSRGFVLVRTVDEKRRLVRRFFHRSEGAKLERSFPSLDSIDVTEQLEALTRLSAAYDVMGGACAPERTPEVLKRLHELEASENAWVREAAKLALEDA